MNHLDGVLKLVDNELGSIEQNGKFRSRDEIDSVYKLIDVAKDIYCIWSYEDEMDNGYSERYGYGYDGGMSNNYHGNSYNNGYSNARGRGRGAKRYANGQYAPYSRDGGMSNRGMSYRGRMYSMDDGKEEYLENLREMMQNAPDENTRQSIQHMIQQMEQ